MNKNLSKWFSLGIVSTAIFLTVIDLFIVNVALPAIKNGVKGSDADMQFIIVMYIIGYAAFLITGGKAGEYYGKKKIFLIGISVFTIASCICGFSQTATQLNVARFIQGISGAFMVPQGLAFIPELFPVPEERVKAFGIYGSIAGVASVIGQFLGGFLPDAHFILDGWRLIFLINLPVGIIAVILGARYLQESKHRNPEKFDVIGALLLMVTLIVFIYPLIQGREAGWPTWSIIMLGLSLLLIFAFSYYQRFCLKSGRPLLMSMNVFKYRDFNIGLCAALFYYMVQDSYFLINTIQLQMGLGVNSTTTGMYFVCQGVGYVVASLIFTRLVARHGKYISIAGVTIMIIGLLLHLLIFNTQGINPISTLVVLFTYGMGCGTVLPALMTMALKNIPAGMVGASSGIYLTLQQISVALGVAIVGGVFFSHLGTESNTKSYIAAYQVATTVNIGFLFIVGVVLFFLPDDKK
ncbi:MFS transporter [Pedobacter steynii]|uniref:MFS transporter n=1 Tax=Pedobacter steynii TaxID=430522 RepID=A0A1D7QEI0_9SPHI|nr:MFS transporter [Pedobacter steynii]AOM77091.1 MFS transporter [Pedobacter steynii]